MKVINVMKKFSKNYTQFSVLNNVGYFGNYDKFVSFECNVENGIYDKEYFTKLGEFKLIQDLNDFIFWENLQDDNFIEFTQDKRIFSDLMPSGFKR